MHTAREQELLSRIATLEERLAKQLSACSKLTDPQMPEIPLSDDDMKATIAALKVGAHNASPVMPCQYT